MTLWKLPPISDTLIKVLDQRFPERCADLAWDEKEIWYKAGQRSVVRLLINEFEIQNTTILAED